MTEKCFDEGTIQAFLDGELESDLLEQVARHTAACEVCAFMLQDAEEESAFAFSALGDQFNSLVPTERIRTNLYQAISEIEKPRKSFWTRIFAGGFSFTNPSLVSFASLLLVAGLFTTLYIHRETQQGTTGTQIAAVNKPKSAALESRQTTPTASVPTAANSVPENEVVDFQQDENEPTRAQRPAVYKQENQFVIEKAVYKPGRSASEDRRTRPAAVPVADRNPASTMMPGEESYVKTITALTSNVNSRKDTALRPAERVAFENDLAVVDDAIRKMQREVRKNPKNEAARQVLRSSYQNKIDLLNSVAERTEMMASLR